LPDEIVQTITGCARCHGEGHEELRFRKLRYSHPGGDHPVQWTHWAICPATGEPILFRKTRA
jgi:hypothetical protein